MKRVLEPFIGSVGILVYGFLSVPFLVEFFGGAITAQQGFKLSIVLFVLRFLWLYMLRILFGRREK